MPGTTLKLEVGFDETPDTAIPLKAFLFTRAGRLVASAPVTDGRINLEIEALDRRELRLFIAPAPADGEGEAPPTLAAMEKIHAYEPAWSAGAVKLRPIPTNLWRRWLARCRVRGRVVVPTLVGGAVQDLPLPHARVRIFEVDPFWILLRRIPPAQLFALRDDLLKMIDRKWIPIPDPMPDPEPDPEPWGPMTIRTLAASAVAPRPLIAGGALRATAAAAAATLSPAALADALSQAIPQRSRIALLSPSVDVVSSTLGQHMELLWPILCRWHWHWPWLWPLLRTRERKVVETDAQGLFDVTIFYPASGDHPDLYFQVDYWIDGAFSPVYKPGVRCHTWWNIPSGTEVTLRVRDPRVSGATSPSEAPPGSVLVERIGGVWVNTIADGCTAPMGLAGVGGGVAMRHAFGGVLAPHIEISPALATAGVTHFRWSYQRIKADGAPLAAGEPWHVVTASLSRIYMEIISEAGAEQWRRQSVPLGPVAVGGETAFLLPPDKPPVNAGQISAWWDQCRYNEASAFLDTRLINPAPEAPAGRVKLRLELFRLNAGKLERVSPGGGFHVPPPGYGGTGDMTAVPAGAAFVESVHDGLCPARGASTSSC